MQKLNWAAIFVAATMLSQGCGAGATGAVSTPGMPVAAMSTDLGEAPVENEMAATEAAVMEMDLSGLPAAPWAAEPLSTEAVPSALLSAWSQAENRASCAPIAPALLGAAEGAEARVSEMIQGGWAVEFDRSGMPGLSSNGRTCARCGRGVFGIAGTGMSPDELLTDEDVVDAPAPSFADGSHLSVEAEDGEPVAAATLTVRGQGCVYQVWSFLGEEHLRELVDGLRRVEVREASTATLAVAR